MVWGYLNPTKPQVTPSASDANYIHNQIVPSKTWVITHNLGKYPSVTIVDSANNVVIGEVKYDSLNQCTVTFTSEFSGKAYLN